MFKRVSTNAKPKSLTPKKLSFEFCSPEITKNEAKKPYICNECSTKTVILDECRLKVLNIERKIKQEMGFIEHMSIKGSVGINEHLIWIEDMIQFLKYERVKYSNHKPDMLLLGRKSGKGKTRRTRKDRDEKKARFVGPKLEELASKATTSVVENVKDNETELKASREENIIDSGSKGTGVHNRGSGCPRILAGRVVATEIVITGKERYCIVVRSPECY